MRRLISFCGTMVLALAVLMVGNPSQAREKYKIAWTIYAGSMPLAYAQSSGILKKWGDKYGFDLEAVQVNDYVEAQIQYAAGGFDGVIAMTLDGLTISAAQGVDSTAVLPLSTSAGSDGIIVRGKNATVASLKGRKINLVELSGSHYMLVRALDSVGLSEKDVSVVNTSDADIGSVFEDANVQAVATWKPQLSQILAQYPDTRLVFSSADIKGEIVDALVVNTRTLKKNPKLGDAIAGAWYEVLSMMQPGNPKYDTVMTEMAASLQTDRDGLKEQLSTIDFFTPKTAKALVTDPQFKVTMAAMSGFAFKHGLLGEGIPSAGHIGIQLGTGDILGNKDNVKLRFPATWVEHADAVH